GIWSYEMNDFEALLAVSNATPLGPYSLTLILSFQNTNGTAFVSDYVLGILVDSVEEARIQIDSISRIDEELELTLENTGNETLKNIFISLKHNGVLLGPPFGLHINEMPPGNKTTLTFQVTDEISFVEITISYDGTFESLVLHIPSLQESNLVIKCPFSSKKANVGSTIIYDLSVKNRGRKAFYYLGTQELPPSITAKFVYGDSELSGLYLEENQETSISLRIDLPAFPRGFIIDEPILFYVVAVDEITYANIMNGSQHDWLVNAVSALQLTLIPTMHDILPISGDSWGSEFANPTSEIHYPGIPYSIKDLPLGAYVTPKFELSRDITYIFTLYGKYVGKDIDLNLHIFNASGMLLNSSSSSRGLSDQVEVHTATNGIFIVVITNDESPSLATGSATLLVTEKWDLTQSSYNKITLDEGHFPNFLIGEVRAMSLDVSEFQGQDMTIQANLSSSLGAELRIYPFTRNSQKEDYNPFASGYSYALSLVRSQTPQTLKKAFKIARDEETLLIVLTKVQGKGKLFVQLGFSNPRVEFWSYSRHRKEILLSMVVISIVGLFIIAYRGEKYLR
ncbi:MAG: hypothetical protein ACE5FT_07385, partial [Candidatus Nanoarchaeia archaeon]